MSGLRKAAYKEQETSKALMVRIKITIELDTLIHVNHSGIARARRKIIVEQEISESSELNVVQPKNGAD